MKTTLILILLVPFGVLAQRKNIGVELHLSGNHPLVEGTGATFFGGGIGANVIFRDTNTLGFKTGIEVNYFHTWAASGSHGYPMDDYHCIVWSIPAMARFSFGKKKKGFFEIGAYVGFGSGRSETESYPFIQYISYNPGVVITPALGFGGRIRLSKKTYLFLKPELGLNLTEWYDYEKRFESSYCYARFCVGIHL